MLAKRIIPCLDIKNGRTVKGTHFVNLRDAGDPVELGRIYSEQGADELVFLDITATSDKRKTLVSLVEKIARDGLLQGSAVALYRKIVKTFSSLKLIASGGVNSAEDLAALQKAGLDGAIVGKALLENKITIDQIKDYVG